MDIRAEASLIVVTSRRVYKLVDGVSKRSIIRSVKIPSERRGSHGLRLSPVTTRKHIICSNANYRDDSLVEIGVIKGVCPTDKTLGTIFIF